MRTLVEGGFETGPLREVSTEGDGSYRVFYQARDEYSNASDPRRNLLQFVEGNSLSRTGPAFDIPAGHYFVMGDNRDNSFDSRFWGTVPRESITGKPYMIYWSVEKDESGNQRTRWNRVFSRLK